MALITWQDSYSVGVAQIDNDHKLLVSLINQLGAAVEEGQSGDVVGSVLNVVIEYTASHFGREELLMEKGGYPGLAAHKAEHAKLTARVRDIVARYNGGTDGQLDRDVLVFLKTWLTGHILGVDRQYTDYVRDVTLTPEELFASIGLDGWTEPEDAAAQ